MKMKSYHRRNDLIIKEKVDFYVKGFGSGIYYVVKDRGGVHGIFITNKELVEKLNDHKQIGIESRDGIDTYTYHQWQFDHLLKIVNENERTFKYRRESQLDGFLGVQL